MSLRVKHAWDAEVDATRAGLEWFMRALLVVGGHFTDSFALGDVSVPRRGVTVFLRVWIPDGLEVRFADLAKIEMLKKPPRIDLGPSFGSGAVCRHHVWGLGAELVTCVNCGAALTEAAAGRDPIAVLR